MSCINYPFPGGRFGPDSPCPRETASSPGEQPLPQVDSLLPQGGRTALSPGGQPPLQVDSLHPRWTATQPLHPDGLGSA